MRKKETAMMKTEAQCIFNAPATGDRKPENRKLGFSFQAQGEDGLELTIYDEIGYWGVRAKHIADALQARMNVKNITVRLNSPGGSALDGNAIYNLLKEHPATVHVKIDGAAFSAASIIAMAGDRISMAENALMMIHEPWSYAAGNASELRKNADVLDKVRDGLVATYAKRTGKAKTEIEKLLAEDTFLSAAEAKKEGFADEVSDAVEARAEISEQFMAQIPEAWASKMERFFCCANASFACSSSQDKEVTKMEKTNEEKVVQTKLTEQPLAKTEIPAPVAQTPAGSIDPVAKMRADMAAETSRIGEVQKIAAKYPDIAAQAISEGWDCNKTELEVLRAERKTPGMPGIIIPQQNTDADTFKALEAGILMAGGFSGDSLLKSHGEKAVNFAAKEFRSIGCQRIIMEAAWANGFTGRSFTADALRAAFSTASLPGILSNVANKQLLAGFESVENDYTKICAVRPVKDFKTITSYRLTASMEFEEVGPGGELKHGEVGEESYTNQAKTYGKMFAITRTMFINDDLDALSAIPRQIGRGSGQKLNKVFWTEFLDNSTFFTEARGNYATGTDTALAIAGLTAAEVLFRAMKESTATGAPRVAHKPQILLVPSALSVVASQLMTTAMVNETTTANVPKPNSNPHVGKYTVVSSGYLDDSAYTGYSAAAYYLLANPMDMPTVELCFLNGVQTPTVERADADFNTLGVQFRGYFDFGASKQDYRGGIKMLGEAEGS
jgi:ATP-dependent Clp endopeptidase proteolytic subunit ClpP